MDKNELSVKIKAEALRLGFDGCGIAASIKLIPREGFLRNWLEKGFHATMHYMARNIDKRVDPSLLLPDAKSIISVVLNYYQQNQQNPGVPLVSKYAYGSDYHQVLKNKLYKLLDFIRHELPGCNARIFVDSAPVLERAWAADAGLGWIGKNTNLIVKDKGSFFFIGEIIIDIELEYDTPIKDYCGSCTKCLDACPTKALIAPYLLDSNRCISYQTIENKGEIPNSLKNKFGNRVFGCDVCQDVCPWNRFSKPTNESHFNPKPEFTRLTAEDWKKIDKSSFKKLFKGSAVERTKYEGLRRNIDFIYSDEPC